MRLLPACALLLTTPAFACPGLQVLDGWIRAAPPGATVMAGYARLHNAGRTTLSVDGASSPGFESVEVHETVLQDGLARMRGAVPLVIAPGATVQLEPGGRHLMLLRPRAALPAGGRVAVALHCGGAQAEFPFHVRSDP